MIILTNVDANKELATSLVGLRMKVSDSRWIHSGKNGSSSGNHLHAERIHFIDFEQNKNKSQNYLQLHLDDVNGPELYSEV